MALQSYDVVVIGGGSAGIVAFQEARRLGFKPLLVEKNQVGGECLYTGCIPSKALIKSAKVHHLLKHSEDFGLPALPPLSPNLENVMKHIEDVIRETRSRDEDHLRWGEAEVLFGTPVFLDPHTIQVDSEHIQARFFFICTGSRPLVRKMEGLEEAGYYTNHDIFQMKKLPESLLIIGGGPQGVEMAQAFQRLGSTVTIFQRAKQILPREDVELSTLLADILSEEGVQIFTGAEAEKIEKTGRKKKILFRFRDKVWTTEGDEIFVADGRQPNIEGLNLEKLGIEASMEGIQVDKHFRTSVKNIYACGDVVGDYRFTHMAGYQAKIAVHHALAALPIKADYRVVPWCTFTDPELARVGETEEEARESRNGKVEVYRVPFNEVDRAMTDHEIRGLIKIVASEKGKILGAHILGPSAGEIIHEFVLAMQQNISLDKMATTIHIYPTLSLGSWQAAEAHLRQVLPFHPLVKFFRRFAPKPLAAEESAAQNPPSQKS